MSGRRRSRALRRGTAIVPVALALALCSPALGASHRQPSPATVSTVQRLFHVLGYPLGHERGGSFGVRTKGALSYFQRKYGLPINGYPDQRTVAEMQAVAASLTAAPASDGPPPRDLIDRLLGGVPIMGLGLACASGLALLAFAARGRDSLTDRRHPRGLE
jgi:peptidoglycan hydrolase-like protein with peptidoglycan-binding domain